MRSPPVIRRREERRRGLLLNLVHPIWQLGGIALALTTTWDAEADSMRVLGTPVTGGQLAFASALPAFVALLAVAIGVRESPLFTLHARGHVSDESQTILNFFS